MMDFPKDYYFMREHQWVHIDQDFAYVGLTKLLKKELGEILKIEIHKRNQLLSANQAFGRIISSRYLCKLIMPFSGIIVDVNEAYCCNSRQFNTCFDKDHWLVKIAITLPIDMRQLFTIDEYKAMESGHLLHTVKYLLQFNSKMDR